MNTKLLKTLRGVGKAGLILTVMLCAAIFCGCAGEVADAVARENDPGEGGITHELGTFEGLSAETEKQILLDYFNSPRISKTDHPGLSVNDFSIYGYFGTYNDYVMVGIKNESIKNVLAVMRRPVIVIIADWYYTKSSTGESIIAWKNGQLYEVKGLYETGNLTLDDLRSIASRNPPGLEPIGELRWRKK